MNEIIAIVCAINSYTHDKQTYLEVLEQRWSKRERRKEERNIEMILRWITHEQREQNI